MFAASKEWAWNGAVGSMPYFSVYVVRNVA